jgi:Phage integrase, N-terminal SAM-like domain
MTNADLIGHWVRRFLVEHLVRERNLSRNTQASYRDTLVQVLPFIADKASVSVDRLTSEHLTTEAVKQFLSHLEVERRCSISTRNQRLAAGGRASTILRPATRLVENLLSFAVKAVLNIFGTVLRLGGGSVKLPKSKGEKDNGPSGPPPPRWNK